MELTCMADWLNKTFQGYDNLILSALHKIADITGGLLTPVMSLISLLGEKGIMFFLLGLLLMCSKKTRKAGVCIFGAVVIGALFTNGILKDWVARPRPFMGSTKYHEWWQYVGVVAEDEFSFPSGHVTAAMAGVTALWLEKGKKQFVILGYVWVILMGISRNYFMVHYPSDVLAAIVVGGIAAVLSHMITKILFQLLKQYQQKRISDVNE